MKFTDFFGVKLLIQIALHANGDGPCPGYPRIQGFLEFDRM